MKKIIVLFGGVSAEHEVSVISGLQVVENIDRSLYIPYAIKLTKDGLFEYFNGLNDKKDYAKIKPQLVIFGRDTKGSFFQVQGLLKEKTYIDAAYLAFHGGNGESGQVQGYLETLGVPYTSPGVESSAVSMNKEMTKELLSAHNIHTVDGQSISDEAIKSDVDKVIKNLKIKLPIIIKPAHLGSSIGINIAKNKVELKKYLLEASHVDSEILVERLVSNFEEFNISVRKIGKDIETSEIEKPLSTDEILSFADKYERGGKKTGGMASLSRELPANINKTLASRLNEMAIQVFRIMRAKGVVRIDFMVTAKDIYVTEVNPIPGSMSFYLWEASGISFKQQISDLIEQGILDHNKLVSKRLTYKSDIVEKFINSKDH